jgi:hypothetical protein
MVLIAVKHWQEEIVDSRPRPTKIRVAEKPPGSLLLDVMVE